MPKDKFEVPAEADTAPIPDGMFDPAKGFKNMGDVSKSIQAASAKIEEGALERKELEEENEELKRKATALEVAPAKDPESVGGDAPPPGHQWGHSTEAGERKFSEDFQLRPLETVVRVFGEALEGHPGYKAVVADVAKHDAKFGDYDDMSNLSSQMMAAEKTYGKEFLDRHEKELNKYLKDKGNEPFTKGEVKGFLSDVREAELKAGGGAAETKEEEAGKVTAGEAAGMEGSGDTETGAGVDLKSLGSSDEMEKFILKEGEEPE